MSEQPTNTKLALQSKLYLGAIQAHLDRHKEAEAKPPLVKASDYAIFFENKRVRSSDLSTIVGKGSGVGLLLNRLFE